MIPHPLPLVHRLLRRLSGRALPPHPIEVVFIGDSLTQFWSDEDPRLFGPGRINAGRSGETTREMRARFAADVVVHAPRVVHIMAGTNDLWHGEPGPDAETAIANIRAMTAEARAAGIGVILAPPPPIGSAAEALLAHPRLLVTLREAIAALARDEGHVYVDYSRSLAGPNGRLRPKLTTDGVHFTRAGYHAMRWQAKAALAAALSRA